MSFSICIVTHNSARELGALFDSIDTHLSERPQIICADSGSTDHSVAVASARGAEVVIMDGNLGFGASNNEALKLAREPVTVLMNPDCRLVDSSLDRLITKASERRALIAPRLLNEDGSIQDSAHPLPGGWSGYLAAITVPRLMPRRLRERLQPFRAKNETEVGWVIGACIVAQTNLLRELGPFSADDFLYAEDMDLCLRARARGVSTVYDPTIRVVHSGQHSSISIDAAARMDLQARRRRDVIQRQLGATALARDDRSQGLTFKLRELAGHDRGHNKMLLTALRHAQNRSN